MAQVLTFDIPRSGWLRSAHFDLTYVLGISVLALLAGWTVVTNPRLFPAVFFLNAWLLGYHHVISTFTRLTFDRESFNEHKFLIAWLPLIVLSAVVLACVLLGGWILTTVYLYWQWWHYTRQSYGISRIYQRKAGLEDVLLNKLVIYALPLWGILFRSYQNPQKFLFNDVRVVPVPFWLVALVGSSALVVTGWWTARTFKSMLEGKYSFAHTLYMSSHLIIFAVGYLAIKDINHGWLVLTVWHNCQYILTVWMFNTNRFKKGIDVKHKILSFISQPKHRIVYVGLCLAISSAVYGALHYSLAWITIATATALPLFAIAFQAINFHHYLVDAVIWKVRRKPVRQNLGIAA